VARKRQPKTRRDAGAAAARHAIGFFRDMLVHTKGEWAGQPFVLLPWQAEVVRQLFGTLRPDGLRQYRRAYIEVPRKNGKTCWVAGLGLYLLLADGESGAEIYSAAADRDQAGIMFEQAKAMVEANADLKAHVAIYRRELVVPSTGSRYRVLSADAPTKHGLNAHGILFDELHAQPNRELFDVLYTSTGARRQPLCVAITTAGYDRNSICWEQHALAVKVRDGRLDDPTFLPVLYGADPEDDWTAEATWRKANPSLGETVKLDYLAAEGRRAQELPGYQNTFKRLHLCLWTEQADRWLDVATWDRGAAPLPDDAVLHDRPCWGGLDLASTHDLTAFVLVWPREAGGYWVRPWFWLPAEGLAERARKDRVPYDVWREQGALRVTEGNVTDYDVIREDLRELAERYQIQAIAFDRWNATQLVTQLQQDGATMVAMGQGFNSLAAPTREVERLVLEGSLQHGGHPVLRWMVANAAVEQDPVGNRKPSKRKSRERIDGVVALIMALGRAMLAPGEGETSAYADHGLVVV
jgi:phage terminase large subunit-like protein